MSYTIGDVVVMNAAFTDPETAAAVIPDSVACTVIDPDGDETAIDVVAGNGPGKYTARVGADTAGRWYFRFAGTGHEAAKEGEFFVDVSPFVPGP